MHSWMSEWQWQKMLVMPAVMVLTLGLIALAVTFSCFFAWLLEGVL